MDFATFGDMMVYAADPAGLVAYVAIISVALFGVWLATHADDQRNKRRSVA
jgi:hypothetical protein